MFPNPADGLCADRAHGTAGAARRRRNRRLRAFLKHERMTMALNLATFQHHSYMKSAVVDVGVQVGSPLAPVIEYMSSAPVIEYLAPAPAVSYPSSGLVDPQFSPTDRAQRHTVEQRIEHTPYVQILDAPVPLKVIPQRPVDLVPQMVEQLVEVPTVLTPTRIAVQIAEQIVDIPASARGVSGSLQGFPPEQSSAQRTASQTADIPVPGRGVFGSPQGSLPEQSTAKRTAEQIVGIPVPCGGHGRLPGSLPGQGSTASAAEQIADIPSSTAVSEQNVSTPAPCRGGLRGGLHGFPPVQGSAVNFPVSLGDADEGFFRTFLRVKKSAKVGARSRSALAAHKKSTPGAYGVVTSLQEVKKEEHQVSPMPDSIEWVELCHTNGRTYFWNGRSQATGWKTPPGVQIFWVGERDGVGGTWYWHRRTRASGYSLPPLPPE